MDRDQIKELVLAIIGKIDYDLAKGFDPETAEEPEYAEEELERLITFTDKLLKKLNKKAIEKKDAK